MATEAKTRSSYITPLELEIPLSPSGENKHLLRKRSIRVAADEERQLVLEIVTA